MADPGTFHQVLTLGSLVFGGEVPNAKVSDLAFLALTTSSTHMFAVFDPDTGRTLAAGAVTLHPGWAFLWAGQVHPGHRRQGLYRTVLKHRLAVSSDLGAVFAATLANPQTSGPQLAKAGFSVIAPIDHYWPSSSLTAHDRIFPPD